MSLTSETINRAIPDRVHSTFSFHAPLSFSCNGINPAESFTSTQHKSLSLSFSLSLVILLNVSYVLDLCRIFFLLPLLLFYALDSKYNKFQHIAGAGLLCYFSTPRVSTIETQLWRSVRAPREPLEARNTCSLMISYKDHNGSCETLRSVLLSI